MTFSTPDLSDEHPVAAAVLLPWRSFGRRERFCGQVVTVRCFEDNSRIKELASTAGGGRVMVVDGGGSVRRALLGDMIAEVAAGNGWSGLVINGAVRDVEVLRTLGLGVMALAPVPTKTERNGLGEVDVTIQLGDVKIEPGNHIYADLNGVLVSPLPLSH